ncbi:electron transfer flavoprotein subunit alpha/FixB family protein [Labilibaculum sp. A4]|uniref:electron transfer flavoprotein subunit alpha/FixB family protein n=1 Tax=Labilibaculum euxinus TaxID=2686357 RepID=UPI000F61EC1D|nr:electron transfer flavoprotein subunit alpha/FixB family protein [Labilibaculum euxinus]MDQ1772180.1 electron transfer flavoprotein subunit alpha/FixB family protein [Labilibaculum euxinus]MWN77882.1 electron transfer flavoprotein subunit alpha/FixB family protein [Labilibaculum euxinus]
MKLEDYKGIYVFIEQREGIIQNVALELLGQARKLADELSDKVYAMLLGDQITDQAQGLIARGADEVIVVDAPELKEYTTEPYTQAICQIISERKPESLFIGATTLGRDLGPRVSARVGTGLTADCTKIEIGENGEMLMTRPAFGGNLMATIVCKNHRPQMGTVRPGVLFAMDADESRTGAIVNYEVKFNAAKFRVKLLETVKEDNNLIDITEARILVSGGRGIGNKEGFEAMDALAHTLNAEVSASRAMVDAGYIGHDRQVGQTGKTVRPDLYFAFGISGAIQHVAGMEDSDLIIAVNKDKHAPIFQVSDLGIVGDAKQIIKKLTERLEKQN